MRLWSLHPKYLDCKGLLAVWREGLLAKKVLEGKTIGYRNHPQLIRFKSSKDPVGLINSYLYEIFRESENRCYNFDNNKIDSTLVKDCIPVTKGQVLYEMDLLKNKIRNRDSEWHSSIKDIESPELNPVFNQVPGSIEKWEKVRKCADRESNPGRRLGKPSSYH